MAVIEQERLQGSAEAAIKAGGDFLRRLMAPQPGKRRAVASARLVGIVEIALVLLAAAAAVPLFWAMFAPGPMIDAPPPAAMQTRAATVVGNPFRLADLPQAPTGDVAPASVETTLDLALHGTWVDAERPSAIIRLPDGVQKTFFIGDAICCGASLAGVYTDQVTISRGGAQEALRLPNKGTNVSTEPKSAVEAAPAPGPAIGQIVRFQPSQAGGKLRMVIGSGNDPELFQSLGLRDGDLLISINNEPAPDDLETFTQVLDGLRDSRMISITVERDGVRLPLDIPLEAGALGPVNREPPQ